MKKLQEKETLKDVLQENSKELPKEKTGQFLMSKAVNKKQAMITLSIVAAIVIFVIVYLVLFDGRPTGDGGGANMTGTYTPPPQSSTLPDSTPGETTVDVLPEDNRVMPEKDPFGTVTGDWATSIRLSGILSGENGRDTVVLTDGQTSYIVGVEEYIGDTDWYLLEVKDSTAILTDGEETMAVGFEGRE